MEEELTAVSPPPAAATILYHTPPPPAKERTALWLLLAVITGFMLPVCACGVLAVAGLTGIGVLGSGSAYTASGIGDAVAVVRVEGTILSGDETDSSTNAISGTVISQLQAAAADPTVKAIILRVDSPGGSVTGSAQIWEAVNKLEKPVVASMSAVAASGGYYVSAPADYIIARPDTLTGSLGVIMTLYDATELIEKAGIKVIDITSGENKAIGSMFAEMTPEQRQILEGLATESYNEFVRIIAEGRGMSEAEVLPLADGRVYSGRQALENGLIDALGDFDEAVQKAAELGGIPGEPRIVEYEQLPSISEFLTGLSTQLSKSEADRALELFSELTAPKLEYRYLGPGAE
jgi:protease IV